MKMKFFVLAAFGSLVLIFSCKKEATEPIPVAPPPPPVVAGELYAPFEGKVSHYLFNSNTNDTSGNQHNAGETVDLEFANDRFGRSDRAIYFNGTSSVMENDGMNANFPFSLSFWVNPLQQNVMYRTLFESDRSQSNYYGYWMQLINVESAINRFSFSFGDGGGQSGSNRNSFISSVSFTDSAWQHVVINVRGSNDMDLYVNGVKDNELDYSGEATSIQYNPVLAGTGSIGRGFTTQYFKGYLDDFRIYNRALSSAEIATLYNFEP